MEKRSILSRRAMVTSGTAAILGAAAAGTQVPSQAASSVNRAVSFTPASAAGFAQMLDQYFPGLSTDPGFAQIRPLSFIIGNQGSVDVKAHSATWTVKTSSGATQLSLPQFFSPRWLQTGSPFFGVIGDQTLMTGQVSLIRQSTLRLASPLFSWSPRFFMRNPIKNWSAIVNRSSQAQFLSAQSTQIVSVDVQLGAVLFGDNVVVGEDGAKLAANYSVRRNAERDAAAAVNLLIKAGAPASAIQAALVTQSNAYNAALGKPSSYNAPQQLLYNNVFMRQSKILLTRFMNVSYQRFAATIQYLSQQPTTVVTVAV